MKLVQYTMRNKSNRLRNLETCTITGLKMLNKVR